MRRALVCLLVPLLTVGLAACSKDEETKVHVRSAARFGAPPPASPAAAPEDAAAEPPNEHATIIGMEAGPMTYTVIQRIDAARPAEDPDLAVIAAGRVAGAACFTGITDGSPRRSATIEVHVLPSGTVNRSEVSSGDTTEPWVLSCLENAGRGLHFADKPASDIRTYSINVSVTRTH